METDSRSTVEPYKLVMNTVAINEPVGGLEFHSCTAETFTPMVPVAPMPARVGSRRTAYSTRIVGAIWQAGRLLLLSWGLLCHYSGMRLLIGAASWQHIHLGGIVSHFTVGVLAWALACRHGN